MGQRDQDFHPPQLVQEARDSLEVLVDPADLVDLDHHLLQLAHERQHDPEVQVDPVDLVDLVFLDFALGNATDGASLVFC